ncbi:MAG: hypothetical protein ACYDGR_10190 [Candidatus Dormibacteria bacterium]
MNSKIVLVMIGAGSVLVAGCGVSATAPNAAASASPASRRAQRLGAAGELVKITGDTLILNSTAGDITVVFTSATTVQKTSIGSISDIAAGKCLTGSGQKDTSGVVTLSTVRLSDKVNGACDVGRGTTRPGGGGTPASPSAGQSNAAFIRGEVTAVSGVSVTIKDSNGASLVVSVPTTVSVARSSSATTSDLAVGQCVVAQGPRDSTSGKVTARTLLIQPAGPSGCFTGAGGRGFGGFGRGGGGRPGGGGAPSGGGTP